MISRSPCHAVPRKKAPSPPPDRATARAAGRPPAGWSGVNRNAAGGDLPRKRRHGGQRAGSRKRCGPSRRRAPAIEVRTDGRAVDAVRLRECDDAFASLVPLHQLVDLIGRQEGLSRPDLAHHHAIGAGRSGLSTVGDPAKGAAPRRDSTAFIAFGGFENCCRTFSSSMRARTAHSTGPAPRRPNLVEWALRALNGGRRGARARARTAPRDHRARRRTAP